MFDINEKNHQKLSQTLNLQNDKKIIQHTCLKAQNKDIAKIFLKDLKAGTVE